MRLPRPLPVILELNDSAAQPAVKRSNRPHLIQISGGRIALTTQVGPRYATAIAPRRAKERQSRSAVLTKPGAAAAASGAALRIDQINGDISSMSEGVDDALGIRIISRGSSREIEPRLCAVRNSNAGTNWCRRLHMVAGGGFEPPTFGL